MTALSRCLERMQEVFLSRRSRTLHFWMLDLAEQELSSPARAGQPAVAWNRLNVGPHGTVYIRANPFIPMGPMGRTRFLAVTRMNSLTYWAKG